jgi:hypothetical protein
MRKVLLSLAGLLLLSTAGLASEARPLTNKQMDTVTGGYIIAIPIPGCDCYLYIRPQPGPPGTMTPMMQTPVIQAPVCLQPSLGFGTIL